MFKMSACDPNWAGTTRDHAESCTHAAKQLATTETKEKSPLFEIAPISLIALNTR
jgi:hypothetical protein